VTQRGEGGVRNVLAELPGERDDEVVIVGAHLDSLHGGTGATDNAAGVVTLLEAVRMMAARAAPWRRTVRIALWGGEELGLHGSRDYIRRHFRGADGQANAAAAQVSAYLNLDYGGGAIRGVYLQGRAPLKPLFEAWFRELPGGPFVTTLRSALGSDQGAFERAGIPGLSFVQDPLNYDTQTHHTTMDLPDHVSTDVLAASARTLAALVERLAMAPSPLPRAHQ
jgi:Zn-dependent M28 family amino/carboxypeptidase